MLRISTLAAALIAATLATPALGCEGTTVLHEDDFSFADPAWGEGEHLSIADGKLTLVVQPPGGQVQFNQVSLFNDFDVCVESVQHDEAGVDPSEAWSGLVFWGIDGDNFYVLNLGGGGHLQIARLQSNRWLWPVDWRQVPEFNPGASNQLRVVGRGSVATVFVNGHQIVQFRGQPPEGGGLLGVFGEAGETPVSFDFTNFKVTSADGAAAAPGPGPKPSGEKTKN